MDILKQRRARGIIVVAVLMMVFGLAEVVTSFTHDFFGVTTARGVISIGAGAMIGLLYILAGLLILTGKRWGATVAISCLVVDVLGRVGMVLAGLYPIDSFLQTSAIIIGTVIAAAFAVYIWSRRNSFG
jgi:uncharacterized membrane protein YccC